jgi:DNA-binding transcriptional regulator YhcF (GntR family)
MCSIASLSAGQRCHTVINMAPTFNPDSLVPLYVQVGSRLPAERDLAEQWGIAYQTVRRTMRELRERGLVASVVGKGTFVTSETPRQP